MIEEEIKQCFNKWTKAWNDKDINGYADSYLDSDKTRYVSGNKVTVGKNNIVNAIKAKGGPKGFLTLTHFEVELMNKDMEVGTPCRDALCFGNKLTDGEDTHGCFTVHVRDIRNDTAIHSSGTGKSSTSSWKILSDHSS